MYASVDTFRGLINYAYFVFMKLNVKSREEVSMEDAIQDA